MTNERLFKEALAQHSQGEYEKAEQGYDSLLRDEPQNPYILHAKGVLCMHRDADQDALKFFQKALTLDASVPAFHQSMGQLLEKHKQPHNAATAYAECAKGLMGQMKYLEAIVACDKSLALRRDKNIESLRRLAMQQTGGILDPLEDARHTVAELKNRARTSFDYMRLTRAYETLGEADNAWKAANKAVKLDPASWVARYMLAMVLLLRGDFQKGFALHEHRWDKASNYGDKKRIGFPQPQWKGTPPTAENHTILVVEEQALGDTIQFSRYAKLLAEQGFKVLHEVHPGLVNLFEEGFDDKRIRTIPRQIMAWDRWHLGWLARRFGHKPRPPAPDELYRNLPFTSWVGSLSLPFLLGTTADNIPAETPYITIKPGKIRRWQRHVPRIDRKPNIGLVWSGDPSHPDDRLRSAPADLLLPLVTRTDARFYSLQKGARAAYEFPAGTVTKLDPLLTDLTETGAAMMCLDLILTVDTAPAHLAGALRRPVWIMLPKVKDWRWLTEGETTGWYPTARLFRHPALMDWAGTVANVNAALDLWILQWLTEKDKAG